MTLIGNKKYSVIWYWLFDLMVVELEEHLGQHAYQGVVGQSNIGLLLETTPIQAIGVVGHKPVLIAQQFLEKQHNRNLRIKDKSKLLPIIYCSIFVTRNWTIRYLVKPGLSQQFAISATSKSLKLCLMTYSAMAQGCGLGTEGMEWKKCFI